MAATLLDVIDTAVKIGLGAAIAGVSSYLVARLDRQKVMDKEAFDGQVKIIRDVAAKVDEFHAKMLDYVCSCPVSLEGGVEGEACPVADPTVLGRLRIQADLPEDELARVQIRRRAAREAAGNLQTARSMLSLLGFPEPLAALGQYKQAAERFWLAVGDSKEPMDAATFVKLKDDISGSYRALYEALSAAFPIGPRLPKARP